MAIAKNSGFSLIELMVAVAIVGIIAAVGYPSYQSMVKNGYRSTAQSDLMALAAAMERHYSANFTYAGAAQGGADTGEPEIFASHSPAAEPEANRKYDLRIVSVNGTGTNYEIQAIPVTGTVQADDGDLVFFSVGRKAWDKNNNGNIEGAENCWDC